MSNQLDLLHPFPRSSPMNLPDLTIYIIFPSGLTKPQSHMHSVHCLDCKRSLAYRQYTTQLFPNPEAPLLSLLIFSPNQIYCYIPGLEGTFYTTAQLPLHTWLHTPKPFSTSKTNLPIYPLTCFSLLHPYQI